MTVMEQRALVPAVARHRPPLAAPYRPRAAAAQRGAWSPRHGGGQGSRARAAAPAVRQTGGPWPPVQRAGHRPHQAADWPSPLQHRTGSLRGRRRSGPPGTRLALSQLPRHFGRGGARVDPVQALTLLRGDWHTGYDPRDHGPAVPPARELARRRSRARRPPQGRRRGRAGHGRRRRHQRGRFPRTGPAGPGRLPGAGQAAPRDLPLPLRRQQAPSLAPEPSATGCPAAWSTATTSPPCAEVLADAVRHARAGGGPTLVEAITYRVDGYTPTPTTPPATGRAPRSRSGADTNRGGSSWDPELQRKNGLLDKDGVRAARDAAEARTGRQSLPDPHEPGPAAPTPHGPVRPRLRRADPATARAAGPVAGQLEAEQEGGTLVLRVSPTHRDRASTAGLTAP
ncbi:hypothetical protein SALBM311S_00964 [Streptomyces alboniger]